MNFLLEYHLRKQLNQFSSPFDNMQFGLWFERQVFNVLNELPFNSVTHLESNPRHHNYDKRSKYCDIVTDDNTDNKIYWEIKTVGLNRSKSLEEVFNFNAFLDDDDNDERGTWEPRLRTQWPLLRERTRKAGAYMILMLTCTKAVRSKLVEICKTNDPWLMSQAVAPLLDVCQVVNIYGHGDRAGVRVFDNIAHFFDWEDNHPDVGQALSDGLLPYSALEECDINLLRVPQPYQVYEKVHYCSNQGFNTHEVSLLMNRLGAYYCHQVYSDFQPKEVVSKLFDEELVESILNNRVYDPATLKEEFDYIDLISLFSALRIDHRIQKTTRRQTVSKLELKALNRWYICIKNPGGSLKDAPPFPTIESAQSWLADHPQTKALQAVFKASRMQTSKHDLRATLMWLGINP